MKKPSIVFFGTPTFATSILDELKAAGIYPSILVTTPDAPSGRNLVLTPPPVKVWGEREQIPILQPDSLTNPDDIAPLLNTEWDLFIVASYGKILPPAVFNAPRHGTINVHPSLLPKFRGASPIRSAILEDERATGVSIMLLDEKMDHGPILAQARIELEESEWPPRGTLFDELMAHAGGQLLAETIPAWLAGEITPEEQDHTKATFSHKITKAMGEIDLADDPYKNLLKIRAFDGWPGTYFFHEHNGKRIRVKIIDARLADDGSLKILRVVPEGKKEMSYEDFMRR